MIWLPQSSALRPTSLKHNQYAAHATNVILKEIVLDTNLKKMY